MQKLQRISQFVCMSVLRHAAVQVVAGRASDLGARDTCMGGEFWHIANAMTVYPASSDGGIEPFSASTRLTKAAWWLHWG